MRIVEYRIFVPFRWDQCRIASAYSVNRRTKDETGGGDGFEILSRRDFVEDGNPGHYVERVLHFKKQVPKSVSWAIPNKYAHLHEDNSNAFPHTVTTFQCEGMGDNMLLHTETRHVKYEKSMELPKNLLRLTDEELGMREIVYLDLLNGPESKKKEFNLKGFSNPDAGILEMKAPSNRVDDQQIPEWVQYYEGEITVVVKVVKFLFKWRGIQTFLENFVAKNVFYHTYLDTHRAMVKWSTEWSQMTIDEVFVMEGEIQKELSQEDLDRS
ncbi:Phosphatidylinositol transfer protein 2 [Tritrichomonas foetus]|uniref:Phosphatidylinositol transfer protein 2 n=1 Tax=Tritrichomonas foetus TaxID=1144522 RepID=A0A1J4J0K3_9EUKA|nr:Phosphatidylinositol transfer protein 2 [Tritrichomonas foetus]|eukprot:OHS93166.1 Phosphatidylinositol transfer protein 2 [Tritrichomonas foetus]